MWRAVGVQERQNMKHTPTMDLLTPWVEAQQSLWERWRDVNAQGAAPIVPSAALMALPLEFWKAIVFEALDAELAAAETWKTWFCATDANIPELTLGACQVLHFAEDWAHAQMHLWEAVFASLEQFVPGASVATESRAEAAKSRIARRKRHSSTNTDTPSHNCLFELKHIG